MTKEYYSTRREKGLSLVSVARPSCTEHFFTVQRESSESFADLCALLANTLRELGATPVSLDVFGVPGQAAEEAGAYFDPQTIPITWIEGRKEHHASLFGLQAWAVQGPEVSPVVINGTTAGVSFRADGLRFCRLGGLIAGALSASRREQTEAVFALMEQALSTVGMSFLNVVRTWFYNRDLLEWYGDFNAVRTRYFIEHGVFDKIVPASTGIGCWNGHDAAALITGLLAVADEESVSAPFSVPSPLQRSSFEYGSAFSRAVEFTAGAIRHLMISGTASIAPQGQSLHIGDTRAQIHLTLDVVQAILESRGMDWNDVARAITYFKHVEDIKVWEECTAARNMPPLPVLLAHTDICRDDLLFEIELDALAR